MSRTFKIVKDYYDNNEKLFSKTNITIEPGLTVLVGCNGTGKTTLLQSIKYDLNNENIPCIFYNNLYDGGNNAKQSSCYYGNMELLATLACSSEGEQIYINFGNLCSKIGRFVRDNQNQKEMWILIDALDSGLSIDNIIEIKALFKDLIIDKNKPIDVYVLISANEYEMCRGEQCFDVRNCKYKTFKGYESFRNFILKSREYKNNRIADGINASRRRGRK